MHQIQIKMTATICGALNLRAELPGTVIDRDYDIPVYATSAQSRHLSDRAVQKARSEQNLIDDQSVGDIITIKNGSMGKQMVYPMGRHVSSALGGIIVGGIFAAAGGWLIFEEGHSIFGSIFGSVGLLIGISCLYLMLNSLEVSKQAADIRTVRRLLGIPIRRQQMHQNSFVRFEKKSTMKSQSGGKHTVYYSIYAVDQQGNEILLGEGFKGESEARAATRVIANELGLREEPDRRQPQDEEDMLGALN